MRSIEDLKKRGDLKQQQKIGVKFYHEFQERIPREEVRWNDVDVPV